MITLAGGLPSPETVPFKRMEIEMEDGTKVEMTVGYVG